MNSSELLSARVVRSSSCTVRIPELDLQVNPGGNSTGYVSNIEGVLNRFIDVINLVKRGHEAEILRTEDEANRLELMDEMGSLNMMLSRLEGLKEDDIDEPITMVLLDPHGHSMILHPDTVDRELTEEELAELPVGPDPAVFSSEELD